MKTARLTGIVLATAAAGMFMASSVALADDTAAGVKCEHSSACKGKGACKTAANSCKGQNACKGEGMTMQKSAHECTEAQHEAAEAAKK
jgi:hypothetical protein